MGHNHYTHDVYLGFASGGILSSDKLCIIIKISFALADHHCDP